VGVEIMDFNKMLKPEHQTCVYKLSERLFLAKYFKTQTDHFQISKLTCTFSKCKPVLCHDPVL